MSVLRVNEKYVKTLVCSFSALYVFLGILSFVPAVPSFRICLPVAFLSVASLWLTPWEVMLGLMFSAVGDYFGSCGSLMAQIGSFALAHIFYTVFFVRRFIRKDTRMTAKMKGYVTMLGICILSLLVLVFQKVVPAVPEGTLRIGVGAYVLLICVMLVAALIQRSSLYALGALLFVISDFALAWTLFVEPVPYSDLLVLGTYYVAQWLLFVRATPYKVSHPVYLMRF